MTVMIPLPVATDERSDPLRLLPYAVNLLPNEVLAARTSRKAMRATAAALALVVAASGYWKHTESQNATSASQALTQAQNSLAATKTAQHKFDDLVTAQGKIAALGASVKTMTTGQIAWNRILPGLRAAAPVGVNIEGVTGTVTVAQPVVATTEGATTDGSTPSPTPTPTAPDGTSTTAPVATPADTLAGNLVISGAAESKDAVAAFVLRLNSVKGVTSPFLGSVTAQEGGTFGYSIQAGLTKKALDTRYAHPSMPTVTK